MKLAICILDNFKLWCRYRCVNQTSQEASQTGFGVDYILPQVEYMTYIKHLYKNGTAYMGV